MICMIHTIHLLSIDLGKLQQPHCDLIIDDGFYGEMIPFCGRTIQGQWIILYNSPR